MTTRGVCCYLDRFSNLSGAQVIEGSLWSLWCGYKVKDWTKSVKEKILLDVEAMALAERGSKVWESSKKLFLDTCSALSGLSVVVCWASEVSIIFIGSMFPYISAGGYWASSLVSGSRAWDAFHGLKRNVLLHMQTDVSLLEKEQFLSHGQSALKFGFSVCIAAWAAFSGLHVLLGGHALFCLADNFFYYGVILFCANLVMHIIQPKIAPKQAS